MSLEFSEAIYAEMEAFVGRRQIFRRAADVVDSASGKALWPIHSSIAGALICWSGESLS